MESRVLGPEKPSSARESDGRLAGDGRPLIRVRNVEKYFESRAGRTYVLRRIDLDVEEGDFITIMGPSGAGKSTLLHLLGMLDGAWSGEYYFVDSAVHELSPRRRNELHKKYIGFVFQAYHLLDDLTVATALSGFVGYRLMDMRVEVGADGLDRGDPASAEQREQLLMDELDTSAIRVQLSRPFIDRERPFQIVDEWQDVANQIGGGDIGLPPAFSLDALPVIVEFGGLAQQQVVVFVTLAPNFLRVLGGLWRLRRGSVAAGVWLVRITRCQSRVV